MPATRAFYCFIRDIHFDKYTNTNDIAVETAELLEKLITEEPWTTARDLINLVNEQIKSFLKEVPHECVSINIMRHCLKIIRQEYDADLGNVEGQSLHHVITADTDNIEDYSKVKENLKTSILDHFAEYKAELQSSTENIASQAHDHIHTNENILTFGISDTVLKFLVAASKTRKFIVYVAESGPQRIGRKMLTSLVKSKIVSILIPDAAIFAVMSRVNRVIIGVHSVMADGVLRTGTGVHTIALAARHYSVPVIALVHMYQISPIYYSNLKDHEKDIHISPAATQPYSDRIVNRLNVINPLFDYVPEDLVSLFIFRQGGNAPSYIYRLLQELYHPDDY